MIKKFFMPERSNLKSVYLWTVLAGLTYAGSTFLMQVAVTKFVGVSEAGILSLAIAIGNQLLTLGLFNIRTFQISDVTERYSFGDYCVLRLLTVSLMLAAGAAWCLKDGYRGMKLAVITFAILLRAAEAAADLLEGRYQQKGRYDVSCKGVFVKVGLYVTVFMTALLVSRNLTMAMAAMALTYIAAIFVIDSRIIGSFGKISFRSTWGRQGRLFMEGLPLFINSFLSTYILNAPKYSIEQYYAADIMGIFTALYMMAFVVNMFASFVLKPIISVMAEKYVKGYIGEFLKLVVRQVVLIAAVTAVCVAGAYFMGVPVLTAVFGIELYGYRTELCILLAGGGFTALYQLFQYGIVILRHQYSGFIGCGLTAAVTYLMTPVLTARYGVLGASVSYTASMGLMSLLLALFFTVHLIRDRRKKKKYE